MEVVKEPAVKEDADMVEFTASVFVVRVEPSIVEYVICLATTEDTVSTLFTANIVVLIVEPVAVEKVRT